jgi:hypothetical protein
LFASFCSDVLLQSEIDLQQKTLYTKNDYSLVYVWISSNAINASLPLLKGIFFPKVDEFSRLEIRDSFLNFANSTVGTQIWLQLASSNVTSTIKRYNSGNYIVGSFSAVIQLIEGIPQAFIWDDGCDECNTTGADPNQCLDRFCAVTMDECMNCTGCTSQTCNIKIFLAWLGTDLNGNVMTSASYLPSNLIKFSVDPVYKAAAGVVPQNFIYSN